MAEFTTAQVKARLAWEAVCERLRNMLFPVDGHPLTSPEDRREAFRLARHHFDELCHAFDVTPEAPVSTSSYQGPVIAIGAGSGGVLAVARLIGSFPQAFPAAVLVTLKAASQSLNVLESMLKEESALPVRFARDREAIVSGHVYLTPPGSYLLVCQGGSLGLESAFEDNGQPRNLHGIDRLFESAAAHVGPRVIGIVMSGSESDGAQGLKAIEEADGIGVVQEPTDAKAPEMPSHVIEADQPHYVARLSDMTGLLEMLLNSPRFSASVDRP